MSSDVGLLSFANGSDGTIPSALLLQILSPFIKKIDDGCWDLKFPDGGGGEITPIEQDDDSSQFWIMRAGGIALFDALFNIMRQTHTLMCWTGCGDTMVTADAGIAIHLPANYIAKYGAPPLVRSGADILAEIAKT